VGLRPFACWDCGFESRRRHGCLYLASVVCCQVEVSASGWSLVQRSPTECAVCLSVIVKPRERGKPWPKNGSGSAPRKTDKIVNLWLVRRVNAEAVCSVCYPYRRETVAIATDVGRHCTFHLDGSACEESGDTCSQNSRTVGIILLEKPVSCLQSISLCSRSIRHWPSNPVSYVP
jgi:hypothetical protein